MRHIFLMLFLISPLLSFGQIENLQECGSHATNEQIAFMESFQDLEMSYKQEDSTIFIPVTYFIARRSDSTGGLNPDVLPDLTEQLNLAYLDAGVQFYNCGDIVFIDSTEVFDFERQEEFTLCGQLDVSGTMNVYFFNSVKSSSGSGLCGYAYFPGGPDRIVMNNSCALNGSTFIHEVGHFFSLYHTHGKTNNGTTDELVDGSNCEFAGDNVCDTPADPNLNGKISRECEYTGSEMDANNDPFDPDPTNIMSYSRKACRTYLSPGQLERVGFSARFQRIFPEPCCPDTFTIQTAFEHPTCEGDSNGMVRILSSNGFGDQQYSWSITGDSTIIEGLPAGQYIAIVTDQLGCTVSDTVMLIGGPRPSVQLMDTIIRNCLSDTIDYPELMLVDSNWAAIWVTEAGLMLDPDSVIGSNMMAGQYKVLLVDTLTGCRSEDSIRVIDDLLDVQPEAEVVLSNFRINLKDTTDQTIDLRQWTFNGELVSDSSEWQMLLPDTGWYSYCLDLENICGSKSLCDSVYVSGFQIQLDPVQPICPDSTGSIYVEIYGDSVDYYVFWENDLGEIGDSLHSLGSGMYTVKVEDEYGSVMSDSVILEAPEAFLLDTLTLQASTGGDGEIEVQARGGTPPYTYSWNNGLTGNRISDLQPGVYTCMITDANGCAFSSGPLVVASVSSSRVEMDGVEFNLYPVPLRDELTIHFTVDRTIPSMRYTILDLKSRIMNEGIVRDMYSGIENFLKVDCSDWPAGVYYFRLSGENGILSRKIIKQ